MKNLVNILSAANGAFDTPSGLDSIIINYFNSLGWWGNLILIVLSLVLATAFGGIIGYQREINGHSAGFRTHILISLGSALIMVLSIYGVPGEATRDPMRLAAAGVTGISFLGAGCIIKNGVVVETSDLDTVKKEASEGNYIFEVDDSKRARLIIGDLSEATDNTHLQVHAEKENIPFLVKKLVLQEVKIYSIQEDVLSLEDAFFKKTGGNIID